jgi:protein phosphatase
MAQPADAGAGRWIEFASRSDVGRVRVRNEDVVSVDSRHGWAVLADGMGGHRGGDVAARLAVATVSRQLASAYQPGWTAEAAGAALLAAVQAANTAIHRAARQSPELAHMGTTLVAAICADRHIVSAHVGDSRLYRLDAGRLVRLTRDHTVVQEQIDGGLIDDGQARHSVFRGLLTRGLGVEAVVSPELGRHAARPGDLFLMCSDGLTDMLYEEEIAALLAGGASLDAIAAQLVDAANRSGGRDNVSVIVARIVL